ncbi:hypothetical protein H311_03465 [Anncaliia algerae PRA109]|nr:hypothetical protein H311_03465 [Anncaliia algerae PRA109]
MVDNTKNLAELWDMWKRISTRTISRKIKKVNLY